MWEFYLAACEMGFRFNGLMVFQLQIARHVASPPITRDSIARAETRLNDHRQSTGDRTRKTRGKPGTEVAE